ASNFRPDIRPPPMPVNPGNAFLPPPLPVAPPGPPRPPTPNDGLFMDLPNTGYGAGPAGYGGGAAYGGGPYMGPPVMNNYHYCPPGPTTADHCKDQKLQEALYFPDGTPRYNWVPPRNPWDTSLPDTVKELARRILMNKVMTRANKTPTAKEYELMSLLGDAKEMAAAGFGQFGGR
ncbi:unnamed protein product, partial [Candidula unifasciata]